MRRTEDRRLIRSGGCAPAWSVFESSNLPSHILTADGVIVEANPAFERLYRAPRQRFVGRHQAVLADGPISVSVRTAERMLREAAAAGGWQGTITNRRSDGWRFATRAHVFPARVNGRRYFVCIQERLRGRVAPGDSPVRESLQAEAASPG